MGLISKIEDKLSSSHKSDAATTEGKHSNTPGLTSSSNDYNRTAGSHGAGTTGHSGLSGPNSTSTTTGTSSSLRHPVQSAESDFARSNAQSSYPGGSTSHMGAGSHIPGSTTGAGSHIPGSTTGAGYGGAGGLSSGSHTGTGGYGTETHPSLRGNEPIGGTGYTGPASSTIGPHSSNTANVMDPRVQPDPRLQGSHNTFGPHQSSMANRMDPRVNETERSGQHHYGRDAALAGGAGTAAAYEAGHHGGHDTRTEAREPYDPYSSAGQRTAASRLPEDNEYGRNGHHGGMSRDREPSDLLPGHQANNPSAIPTAGGAKVGSSGYDSSRPGYDDGKKEAYRQSAMGGPNTAGPHKSDMMNKLDPRVDSDRSKEQDHHYGRDAGMVGGAGAAGYEADRHLGGHNRDHSGSHGVGSTDTGSHGLGHSSSNASSHGATGGGIAPEKKMGGAYEAGYRDAVAHMKAEMGQN